MRCNLALAVRTDPQRDIGLPEVQDYHTPYRGLDTDPWEREPQARSCWALEKQESHGPVLNTYYRIYHLPGQRDCGGVV